MTACAVCGGPVDPDCPLEETTVTDPQPLTDDELEAVKNDIRRGWLTPNQAHRLVATVEQTRKERDAARAQLADITKRRDEVIQLSADKLKDIQRELDTWRVKWEQAQADIDALVGDSIALRMARATTEEPSR